MNPARVRQVVLGALLLAAIICCGGAASVANTAREELLPAVVSRVFGQGEELVYDISWSGGITIGELTLEIRRGSGKEEFAIEARVLAQGLFRTFYPVDDRFVTRIRSPRHLPYRYEVLQREGWGRNTTRVTLYDQEGGTVFYRRDEEELLIFPVAGPVHNEFSSFFVTRCTSFATRSSFVVPTFADKKRHEVEVKILGPEEIDSIYGPLPTVRVQPKMTFRGLYDKNGDTVIWFTADECRIPVKINSKIVLGSLTARLVGYANSACSEYNAAAGQYFSPEAGRHGNSHRSYEPVTGQ